MTNQQLYAGFFILTAAGPLAAALAAQYGFGYAPCELCIWQRYPYGAILLLAFGYAFQLRHPKRRRGLVKLICALWLVSAGLAGYHFGVEQHYWQAATGCSAAPQTGQTLEALREQIFQNPLVACDQPALTVLWLSMAAWNLLYSGCLALTTIKILYASKKDA